MGWLLFFWFACAVLCSTVAGARNRSAAGWLFAGLVFGVFALVTLLAQPALSAHPVRPCPACFGDVDQRATVCRYCGSALPSLTSQPPKPAPPSHPERSREPGVYEIK